MQRFKELIGVKDLNSKALGSSMELYKKLYLIRSSEQEIIKHYHENEMKTPMHMSMGEEAVVVGVCSALQKADQVFGSYRSHALYLSKTQDTDDFFAEMYGKETALLKGKGGSMHLYAPQHGVMGTSAIVASIIPVAVGAAFANLQLKNNKIVAAFFGDGAIDEGVFWESLNVASFMKLPVLFVCEDNGYAVHSPVSARHGYDSITSIVEKFRCAVFSDNTTDVERISKLANRAVGHIRTKQGPCFLHLKYYRYLEHVGIKEDFSAGYRSREEFAQWKEKDPVSLQRNRLKSLGYTEDEIATVEQEIQDKVFKSIKKAQNAPFVDKGALYEEVV